MKFHRSAAVLISTLLLGAGAAFAVNAAIATDPIRLCSHHKSGAVSVPDSGGACAKGTSEFFVANTSDVQALAGRVDDVETTSTAHGNQIARQEAVIESLRFSYPGFHLSASEVVDGEDGRVYDLTVEGHGLKPGSPVSAEWASGTQRRSLGTVLADRTINATVQIPCGQANLAVHGLAPDDDRVMLASGVPGSELEHLRPPC